MPYFARLQLAHAIAALAPAQLKSVVDIAMAFNPACLAWRDARASLDLALLPDAAVIAIKAYLANASAPAAAPAPAAKPTQVMLPVEMVAEQQQQLVGPPLPPPGLDTATASSSTDAAIATATALGFFGTLPGVPFSSVRRPSPLAAGTSTSTMSSFEADAASLPPFTPRSSSSALAAADSCTTPLESLWSGSPMDATFPSLEDADAAFQPEVVWECGHCHVENLIVDTACWNCKATWQNADDAAAFGTVFEKGFGGVGAVGADGASAPTVSPNSLPSTPTSTTSGLGTPITALSTVSSSTMPPPVPIRHGAAGPFKLFVRIYDHSTRGRHGWKCDYCDKEFKNRADLTPHFRTHTGEKPYVCEFPGCNKSYAHVSNWRAHEKIHRGQKRFACEMDGCDRSFVRRSALRDHQLTHKCSTFRCTLPGCGASFKSAIGLARHKKQHEEGTTDMSAPTAAAAAAATTQVAAP